MLNRLLLLLFVLILLFSCNPQTKRTASAFVQIKKLTYSREPDVQKWTKLFESIKTTQDKYQFVLSAGQTKLDTLFPLLQTIFDQSEDDSLRSLAIFAMGQVDPLKSTDFFLQLLSEGNLTPKLKEHLIAALGFCGKQQSAAILEKLAQNAFFKESSFLALAQLARAGKSDPLFLNQLFDSAHVEPPSPAESYYFYSNKLTSAQMHKILNWLSGSNSKTRIFLLKKLSKFTGSEKHSNLLADSANGQTLRSFLLKELSKSKNSWHALLPEIALASHFKDSVFFAIVQKHTTDSLPCLRLQAFKALKTIDAQKALPLLVDHFSALPFTYEKAEICKLINSVDPSTGYLLINQNLDKGNSYFKKILLNALAETKFPLAIQMLRQFLQVDDPILIEGAFSALKNIHGLEETDARELLNSNNYSVVALVLSNWYSNHQPPAKNVLLHLFKTFHQPNQFELQLEIASLLQKQGALSLTEKDTLRKYIAHPFITRQLFQKLGIPSAPKAFSLKSLPKYLLPDSLRFTGHPIVEVKTSKGSFRMKLFPKYAPLTVKNFLHLAKQKFYDKLFFHRVVNDFVIQGGDPTGTGWGGPNYLIPSEHSPLPFVRGSVGIATAGFDTGGSQFFICHSAQPHLNGRYTAFGKVVQGMNMVDKIEQGDLILTIRQVQ